MLMLPWSFESLDGEVTCAPVKTLMLRFHLNCDFILSETPGLNAVFTCGAVG